MTDQTTKAFRDEIQTLRAALRAALPHLQTDMDLSDAEIQGTTVWRIQKRHAMRHVEAALATPTTPDPDVANLPHCYCAEHADAFAVMVGALAFARSCIKSGEPWTQSCEERIEPAIRLAASHSAHAETLWLDDLAKNLPRLHPGFLEEVRVMPRRELQRRCLIGSDWQGAFGDSLDGLKEIACIPGSGIDGCRDHRDIRRIVETLLAACPLTWEDTPHGRRKAGRDELIYLASPYAAPAADTMEARVEMVNHIAAGMMLAGKRVYSPLSHNHPLVGTAMLPRGWAFWRAFDLPMLALCSKLIVLQLPGWEKSVGVQAEIDFAKERHIPVEYLPAPPDIARVARNPNMPPTPPYGALSDLWNSVGPNHPRCGQHRANPAGGPNQRCLLPQAHDFDHRFE